MGGIWISSLVMHPNLEISLRSIVKKSKRMMAITKVKLKYAALIFGIILVGVSLHRQAIVSMGEDAKALHILKPHMPVAKNIIEETGENVFLWLPYGALFLFAGRTQLNEKL